MLAMVGLGRNLEGCQQLTDVIPLRLRAFPLLHMGDFGLLNIVALSTHLGRCLLKLHYVWTCAFIRSDVARARATHALDSPCPITSGFLKAPYILNRLAWSADMAYCEGLSIFQKIQIFLNRHT